MDKVPSSLPPISPSSLSTSEKPLKEINNTEATSILTVMTEENIQLPSRPTSPAHLPSFSPSNRKLTYIENSIKNDKCMMDILPDPICIVDANGAVLAMNSLFRSLLTSAQLPEFNSVSELWNADIHEVFLSAVQEIRSSTGPLSRHIHVDEVNLHCEWILSGDSKHDEFIITARYFTTNLYYQKFNRLEDFRAVEEEMMSAFTINAEKHVEVKKQEILAQLELDKALIKAKTLSDMLESKRLIVRTVSHEMRTPLNIVATGLQVLLVECNKLHASAEVIDTILEIEKACSTAVEILSDLLAYEKIEGGVQKLELTESPIEEVIQKAINQFRPQLIHKNLSITFKNHFGTLSCEALPLVLIDKVKFDQVLRNILSNAIKFSRVGGTIFAELMLLDINYDDKVSVRFQVTDSGPGISREDQLKLFRDIVQFKPNELQNGGGSGLGLWISRGIMDLHHGRIGVFSEGEGYGCTFYIDLELISYAESRPRRRSTARSIEIVPTTTMKDESILNAGNKEEKKPHGSMLLVDDSMSSRKMARRALHSAFTSIEEAEDGLQALIRVAQSVEEGNPISIVLMDSHMPRLNGGEAASLMRKIGFTGKIFGLTGDISQEDTDSYISNGADFVFSKPLNASSLQTIANYMTPDLADS